MAATSRESFLMTGAGGPAGANSPMNPDARPKPGTPLSAMVGISGATGNRLPSMSPRGDHVPRLDMRISQGEVDGGQRNLSGDEVDYAIAKHSMQHTATRCNGRSAHSIDATYCFPSHLGAAKRMHMSL
jgi:hypothetical protein